MGLYRFRKELLEELIYKKNEVYISLPDDEFIPKLKRIGCKFIETPVDRRGTNPITDLKLLYFYKKMIRRYKPDVILTYTIKPNIYGGIACRALKTHCLTNITGLGTSIENQGLMQKITLTLYKFALRKTACIFFQNDANRQFFIDKDIMRVKSRIIPGSGVNLKQHIYEEYPAADEIIKFLFIGRIMKSKGINEFLEAAKRVKEKYPNVQFDLIGGCEENYTEQLTEYEKLGILKYHGKQNDVHSFIKKANAIVLPSYHEGMANVLLESAATGRPVLASNIPGCKETFEEGLNGLGFKARSAEDLTNVLIKFIKLPYEKMKSMGTAGRSKMENEFDRNIVVNAYLEEINSVMNVHEEN